MSPTTYRTLAKIALVTGMTTVPAMLITAFWLTEWRWSMTAVVVCTALTVAYWLLSDAADDAAIMAETLMPERHAARMRLAEERGELQGEGERQVLRATTGTPQDAPRSPGRASGDSGTVEGLRQPHGTEAADADRMAERVAEQLDTYRATRATPAEPAPEEAP